MPRSRRPEVYEQKLEEVRERLLKEDLRGDELAQMQTHIDLLERALSDELDFHHHDTNEHHDHVTIFEASAKQRQAVRERLGPEI